MAHPEGMAPTAVHTPGGSLPTPAPAPHQPGGPRAGGWSGASPRFAVAHLTLASLWPPAVRGWEPVQGDSWGHFRAGGQWVCWCGRHWHQAMTLGVGEGAAAPVQWTVALIPGPAHLCSLPIPAWCLSQPQAQPYSLSPSPHPTPHRLSGGGGCCVCACVCILCPPNTFLPPPM